MVEASMTVTLSALRARSLPSECGAAAPRMLTLLLPTLAMIAGLAVLLTATAVVAGADEPGGETWRGLVVAAEDRCSVYIRDDYGPAAAEEDIAKNWGGWWSPYDGTEFPNRESDREHIVAVAEAHDSGLCAAAAETRRRFGRDLDNLTLAPATLNRHEKVAKDVAEWQPKHNLCWFAGRVLAVKLEYGLTVDPQEAAALEAMLEGCRIEHVLRPYRPEPSPCPQTAGASTGTAPSN